jgi:hypothetical protein
MLATERDDSALLPGMFRLAVTAPDEPEPMSLVVNGPFALVGRDESCICRLNHADVSRRHAYLQAIYGRIFCVDLGSRTGTHWGESSRKSGWLDRDVSVRIGPYHVQVTDSIGLGTPSTPFPENFSPLDPYAGQFGILPRVELEILNGGVPTAEMTISRLITLVGSSPRCKLRLQHPSVARVDCSLLWLSDGLWIVDVSGRGHSRLRGKVLRCARLENEQTLRLGRFHLRVRYVSGLATGASRGMGSSRPSREGSPESLTDGEATVVLEPAGETEAQKGVEVTSSAGEAAPASSDAEHAALLQGLAARREAADARDEALDAREQKLTQAQGRLASEWEQLHVDRAAYDALAADFARRQEELAFRLRRLAEETESLGRQRIELANRANELAESKQRLNFEWHKLWAERGVPMTDSEPIVLEPKEPVFDANAAFEPSSGDPPADGVAERWMITPAEFDVLESVRHNKVFAADRAGTTLIVMPLGDAPEFLYGDVHVESNKVRRLLEGGAFHDLLIDFGNAPIQSPVTINVFVALSRIASNRGGRAMMCQASEKTRSQLQTMKLLEVWPLFETREEAIESLSHPPTG